MPIKLVPKLASHSRRDASYFDNRISGTLFDDLEVTAVWNDDENAYKFSEVILSHRPKTVFGTDDRRFKRKVLTVEFTQFCSLVHLAIANVKILSDFCEMTPHQSVVYKNFNRNLTLSTDGFFFTSWPHAPIFNLQFETQKAAALAIIELLSLECQLPRERL